MALTDTAIRNAKPIKIWERQLTSFHKIKTKTFRLTPHNSEGYIKQALTGMCQVLDL